MPDKTNSWVHRGDSVRIGETPVGKGVFANRSYPVDAVIGEITGERIRDRASGSSYSFEIDDQVQLEPFPPFRFLNHSCEPNCEFDWLENGELENGKFENGELENDSAPLYVIALREIRAGEELTIDYNWPANCAIPCVLAGSMQFVIPLASSCGFGEGRPG